MVASIFCQTSNVTQQFFMREIDLSWSKKSNKSLAGCLQTVFSQIARIGYLISGVKKNIAVAVCVLASNKKVDLSNLVSKVLEAVEFCFAIHSLLFANAIYGSLFLTMHGICHLADSKNNDTAKKLKLFFVGYFSSLSKIVMSQGLEMVSRIVNTLFFTKIICDRYVLKRDKIAEVNENDLFLLPLTEDHKNSRERIHKRLHEIVKYSWNKNSFFRFYFKRDGYDEMPEILALKLAAYSVIDTELVDKALRDPYVVGASLGNEYNFPFGYVFTANNYVGKMLIGESSNKKITSLLTRMILTPYNYLCEVFDQLVEFIEVFFGVGDERLDANTSHELKTIDLNTLLNR